MAKFRKKPVEVDAYTFAEFVQAGRDDPRGSRCRGEPWSFTFHGRAVTHERSDLYLMVTNSGVANVTPQDMVLLDVKGDPYPCPLDVFAATYEAC
jgi:hypothetical protein